MVVRAQWFQDRPENKRSIAKEMKIKRGDIVGYDGSVIAGTERRSGYYYRDYPNGTLAPQLVGYDSVQYGRSGIESQLNDAAHRSGQRPRCAELGGQAARAPAQGRERQAHARAGGPEGRPAAAAGQEGRDRRARPEDGRAHRFGVGADVRPGQPRRSLGHAQQGPHGAAAQPADPGALRARLGVQGRHRLGRARHRQGHARRRRSSTPGTYVVFGGKVTNYGGEVYGPNNFT